MASLLHFEEKVHKASYEGNTILLLFLGCYAMFWHIWVSLQTLILRPATIVERASLLTNGISSLGAVLEAASSDAPPATLTTTQTTIMERMDHFQLRQDQQTLILREIQQHLGLLPPAPPVSPVPSETLLQLMILIQLMMLHL
ncbi:hypothetical protein CK203_112150 [Vitis vinifera]|uniref:Uncharacterized protein n=1 Tax=Vitis vinifera TaxID=29760 RepID=A0A438CBQ8_VITVI|nr:hypothetical protein CK203_112150 [Vitis vinifera]